MPIYRVEVFCYIDAPNREQAIPLLTEKLSDTLDKNQEVEWQIPVIQHVDFEEWPLQEYLSKPVKDWPGQFQLMVLEDIACEAGQGHLANLPNLDEAMIERVRGIYETLYEDAKP